MILRDADGDDLVALNVDKGRFGLLNGQLTWALWFAAGKSQVKDLLTELSHRPFVGGNVVIRHNQIMLGFVQLQQLGPEYFGPL